MDVTVADLPELPHIPNITLNMLQQQLTDWFKQWIHRCTGIALADIHSDHPITEFGLDSIIELTVVGSLSDWLQQDLSPYLLYQYATLAALIGDLAQTYLKNHHE